jgi:hypothetical protein
MSFKERRVNKTLSPAQKYNKIYDYIMNKNVLCLEITKPWTEKSKEKNIYRFTPLHI